MLQGLHAALQPDVPAQRWCALTLDPATSLPTGGVHEHGVSAPYSARMLELEFRDGDVNALAELARAARPVATLASATGGDPARSARFREVLAPDGLAHELRAVFRDAHGAWAALVLLRADGQPDFSPQEVELVQRLGEMVTCALRRVLLLGEIEARDGHDSGPALLVLDGDPQLEVRQASAGAAFWLGQIDDGSTQQLPYALYSLALRARQQGRALARMRTRAGRWLTAHAEPLQGAAGPVSLILQPSRPHEVAQLLCGVYDLTPREAGVARLVAAGCSNPEIARLLFVSRHTVEDHLKKVYAKLSVNSRSELVARLFFDQYLPRSRAGLRLNDLGWFAREPLPR